MTDKNISDLLPIAKAQIGAGLIETTSARALHAWLEVGKDFSNWIKGRIEAYQFVEGQDFVVEARSPELASGNRGASIEYHLTLDMAKELSMVERNAKGKEARRHFIRCEQIAKASVQGLTGKQVGGIAKAVLNKALTEFKAEMMAGVIRIVQEEVAAHAAPSGQHHTTVEFVPALLVIDEAGVPAKGRGGLVRKASNSLARFCYRNGHLVRAEAHTDRRLFHVEVVAEWLKADGMPMIKRHLERLSGQSVMQFPKGRRLRPLDGGGESA